MPFAERSIGIRRPADQVFRFLSDARTALQWRASEYVVTAVEPDRIAVQMLVRGVPATGAFALEAMGDATILTFSLGATPSGWRRLVLGPFLQSSLDAEMRSLDQLQELLER